MTFNIKRFCTTVLCSITMMLGVAVAQNPPAIISPTSTPYPIGNGIAPNGIAATPSGIFFTQPFMAGLQPRGIYSITTAGAVASVASIPELGDRPENEVAIAPSLVGSTFTAGDKFATGISTTDNTKDAVYKNGSASPFIDGLPATISHHQSDVSFDSVGTFGGALIVSADTTISLYNSTGMKVATYSGPSGFVLQASTVAPVTYGPCPGCIFISAMPASNIDNFPPTGNGKILTVAPGTPSGSPATTFIAATPFAEPESIEFVTNQALSCSVGGFSYFGAGYATDSQLNNPLSTTGAILAWTPAQLKPLIGHFLVQNEEDGTAVTGPTHGTVYVDGTATVFSDTKTASNAIGYQLESTSILQCPGGCPATFGFFKHFGLPAAMPLMIGCHTYTLSELASVLSSNAGGGNAVIILGHQLIGALANYAAGATQTVAASNAIAAAQQLLCTNSLVLGVSDVQAGTPLGQQLTALADILDSFNSSAGSLNCQEGAGLILN